MKPKEKTLKRIMDHTVSDSREDSSVGLKRSIFIGKVFSGSKELFKEACDEGDAYEEDGLWYYDEHRKTKREVSSYLNQT